MRRADINQILVRRRFRIRSDKRFGEWEKMPEAALPNPRRICDARVTIRGRDLPPSGVGIGLKALVGARSR
jgi:hypothetical protein